MNIPIISCFKNKEENNDSYDIIKKCFICGFFMNVATILPNGKYRTLNENKIVSIHPSSILFLSKSPCVLYNELVIFFF